MKMSKESLYVDIKYELDHTDFNSRRDRDNSYVYIYDKCQELSSKRLRDKLLIILDDVGAYPRLQDAYFKMLEILN